MVYDFDTVRLDDPSQKNALSLCCDQVEDVMGGLPGCHIQLCSY